MFKFLKFGWLLKFIYLILKLSGFLYISINIKSTSINVKRHFWNNLISIVSFGLSLVANTYDAHLPVAEVTHSKLLDFGVNMNMLGFIWISLILRITNAIQSNRFLEIMSILQWCEKKVS